MAEIRLTIPDDKIQNVVDALCDSGNYDGEAQVGETKAQFAKRMLAAYLNAQVKSYAAKQAADITIT